MDQPSKEIIDDFRFVHQTDAGRNVLADTLMDLGFLGIATTEEQTQLRNYAVRVIEKMGVVTPGEKYQLALGIAHLLQQFIPSMEEKNGE